MTDYNEDLRKRVTHLEITQANLIDTQERIINDLKETSSSLRQISIDIGVLVGTVKTLADTVSKQGNFVDRAHEIEVSMQQIVQRTNNIPILQKKIEDVERNSQVNSLITKATAFIAGGAALTILGIMINNILM